MTHDFPKMVLLAGLILMSLTDVASARMNDHAVVRDERGQVVITEQAACVRTEWRADNDACAANQIVQATHGRTRNLTLDEKTVYFDFDRSYLTPEAKRRLDTLAEVLKGDESVKEAQIVGYADRLGTMAYNEKLSQKRALAVRDYLLMKGYTNARVTETRWVGEREPTTSCPAMKSRNQLIACLQADRRVGAEFVYLSEE